MNKINPRVDIAFKKIFGVEENKDLLMSLINSVVSETDQVSDVTLLNPYSSQNYKKDKLSILDIKARGVDDKLFNIEIQIVDEADYHKRALFYWGKLYTEQLRAGDDYWQLSKAIGIHILNFTSIPELPKYHNVFHVVEKESGFVYFKDLELHTIELKKFTSNPQEKLTELVAKVQNSLDVWSAFLTRHELLKQDELPQVLDNPSLKKALTVLEIMNFNQDEQETYQGQLNWLRLEDSGIRKAQADAMERGKAEGKIEMAKNLLKAGVPIGVIAESSGLTAEDIAKLQA